MTALGMRFELTRDAPYSRNETRGRWVDIDSSDEESPPTIEDWKMAGNCCSAIYCGPMKGGTGAKVCRIATYTITGGIGGAILGSVVPGLGTATGFGVGCGVGFVAGCIKVAADECAKR